MPNHEDEAGRAPEPVLTTEDLARPASAREDAALYPGEATGERDPRDRSAQDAGTRSGTDPGMPSDADADSDRDALSDRGPLADRDAVPDRDAVSGNGREGDGREPGGLETGLDREPAPQQDGDPGADDESLLGAAEAERYRTTWNEIQGRFVDEPREAVRAADTLVAEVMQAFAGSLADHRSGLEKQWDHGEQVATEDLRQALRAYRSLVNRLLDT
ncbi:hypothetical protein ABZY44_04105 [Streptomyces sp. NPDC006544]|uniref:hypothetical protein n=1 Tax=Streptomyces sp. NPDC006544 TaxID=3154583 RepID=UPI00339E9917